MANENTSVVNVITAKELVVSSSAVIQHLQVYNDYLQLQESAGGFCLYSSQKLDAFLFVKFHEYVFCLLSYLNTE